MYINTIFYYMSLYTLSFLLINKSQKTEYMKFIICFICSIFIFTYNPTNILLIHIFIIFLSSLFTSKNNTMYINLYYITLSATIIMIISFILKIILSNFYPITISIPSSYIICFVLIFPIYHLLSKLHILSSSIINSAIPLIFPIIYFIMLFTVLIYTNINNNNSKLSYVNNLIDIIILSIIIISYIISSIIVIFKNFKKSLDKKELDNLMEYISIIDDNYNKLKHIKHDLNNIMLTLDSYIYNNNIDDLKKYYTNLTNYIHNELKGIYTDSEGLSYIDNLALKSILLAKINLANDKNIKVELIINQNFNISEDHTINVCRMIGILLDNAIEETEKLSIKNKKIKIIFAYDNYNFKTIQIINNYRKTFNTIDLTTPNIHSSKGENRGLGLKEIRNIIKHNKKLYFSINQTQQNIETIISIKENT